VAGPSKRSHPVRSLLALLALTAALFGLVAGTAALKEGGSWAPKLGLDLEGGTQIVLEPVLQSGGQVTAQLLQQSRDIIEARVNGSGVAEAEIATEGGRNVVVSVPGKMTQRQRDLIKQSSQLQFRPVLVAAAAGAPQPAPTATPSGSPTSGATATPTATPKASATPSTRSTASPTASSDQGRLPSALVESAASPSATASASSASSAASPSASARPSATPSPSGSATTPAATPANPSDLSQITPALEREFAAQTCVDRSALQARVDDPKKPVVACESDGSAKYILGPVEVSGTDISDASAGLQPGPNGSTTNVWEVRLQFDGDGSRKFRQSTTRLYSLQPPQNQFAIVLDNLVISAPSANEPITGGQASITGSFTQASATTLANQLKYGALPLSFTTQTEEQISPLLGKEQLQRGLLAGLIGLVLVVVYSLFQYRALGFVTVFSLVVASVITYALVVLLGNTQGLRLTLAGITGLIVSIGVTADSFIVYFERVRDEVREGRSLKAAVETGWGRARRTILAADAINFLAAVVLYILAAGGVRGFAFTLGLSTIVDIVVVFLFTHPMLTLLARTEFFGQGHRFSGLDPQRLGSTARAPIGVKANLGTIASRRAAAARRARGEVEPDEDLPDEVPAGAEQAQSAPTHQEA
jgi:preprotein translocase subunit SecD